MKIQFIHDGILYSAKFDGEEITAMRDEKGPGFLVGGAGNRSIRKNEE